MIKFGGSGRSKQACLLRRYVCLHLWVDRWQRHWAASKLVDCFQHISKSVSSRYVLLCFDTVYWVTEGHYLFPFYWPFSRWTWVSRYQNVSILDFNGAKDDGSGGDDCHPTNSVKAQKGKDIVLNVCNWDNLCTGAPTWLWRRRRRMIWWMTMTTTLIMIQPVTVSQTRGRNRRWMQLLARRITDVPGSQRSVTHTTDTCIILVFIRVPVPALNLRLALGSPWIVFTARRYA